jgi:hypothetical protein
LGTTDPDLLAAPQAQFDDQGGIQVRSAQELLYRGASTAWSVDPTIPTVYAVMVKFGVAPSGAAQDIFCGQDGLGGGWTIELTASNTLRFRMMATYSGSIAGSNAVADGRWHLLILAIDDANNRGTLITEWGSATLTGVSYSEGGSLICTIGPTYTGASFPKPTSYVVSAKGKNSDGYTEAANIHLRFRESLTANAESWFGGTDDTGELEATGTLAEVSESAVDAFDAEWPEETYFGGGYTADSATHYGEYDSSVLESTDFIGGFTCDSAQHSGAFTCSKIARVSHKQAAIARIVWQLRGNYDNAQCDLTGGITNDSATHGGTYG